MSVIHVVYARTTLTPDEFLDLFIDCLPDEAKKNGVQFDTSYGKRGVVETLSLTPDVVESNDSFIIRLVDVVGFMPTIRMGAKLRDKDGDRHYFQAAFELIRRKNLDLTLDYFDRLALINCSGELKVGRNYENVIKEAMGDNPLPYKVTDFPDL